MIENLTTKQQLNNILINDWNNGETISLISNKECVIQMINPFAEKNLGYNSEEVVGKMLVDDLFDKDELSKIAKSLISDFDSKYKDEHCLYALIKEFSEVSELKLNMIRKDGSKFPVLLNILKTGNKNECYSLTANFNAAKKISELSEIDNRLVKLLEKEKKINEVRKQYLNIASHEFRTPLSIILSSAFILSKFEKAEEQEQREEQIKHIISAVNFLRDIINDFLTLSKVDEGQLKINRANFNSKELITETINDLSVILKKGQKISYKHVGETNLFTDVNAFKHLLINILSNAIKFSPENVKIIVSSKFSDGEYIMSIKDHGFGISEEDQKMLFTPFFRGSNAKEVPGTGLGLNIVQYYLDKMNGKIKVKSKIDKGTTIEISFKDVKETSAVESDFKQTNIV
jgi:signal transduction histidine kinase